MQIEVSVAYFYMCVVYLNYMYYVITGGCIYLYGTLVLFRLSFIR